MKKLMIFLMVTIPLLVILIVNFTIDVFLGDVYIAVERIEITPVSIEAKVDDKIKLTYKIYPENATNKDVIWQSDDESVVVVDPQGYAEFKSYGSGYITAITQDGKRATCDYFVTDDKVHRVVLSADSNELAIGETMQLGFEVLPSGALNKDVSFESDNEFVAEVDANGRVLGKNLGYATIKVTTVDGGKTDSLLISVVKPVEQLIVDKTEVICASPTYQVHYNILPLDASNKQVNFTIDKEDMAEIDEMGNITFKKAGEFNLTITTVSGNRSQVINFIYTGGYAYQLSVADSVISAKIGDLPKYINYTVLPNDITEKVSFHSDNEDIARVDGNGLVQFIGGGDTIIHVFIKKNESEYLEQEVNVHIENPASDILIDDEIVSALPEVMLLPKSYPEDSTNKAFFFKSLSPNVNVSQDGLVTFLTDEAMTAQIEIRANSQDSNVKKIVKVVFTAGKATQFELISTELEILCDQTQSLSYLVLPANAQAKPTLEIMSSSPNVANSRVIEILSDGSIRALNGGSALVKASMTLFDGTIASKTCLVHATRLPSGIEINLNLEYYNNSFVTADKVVQLSATLLPLDCTSKEVEWSVDNNDIAIISNGELIFNGEGLVELTAKCGQASSTINVYFSGSSPLAAEVGARFASNEGDIPDTINADESFEVFIRSILPSRAQNREISLSLTNEVSLSTTKHVLTIEGTRVLATAGGKATLIVNIANSIILTYDITVIREVQEIIVTPADTTVSTSKVELNVQVLPQDASNKEVRFELSDSRVATIEGNILTFIQDGLVRIRAYSVANKKVEFNFYIEKIAKEVISIPNSALTMTTYKGSVLAFDLSGKSFTSFTLESQNKDVVIVEDEYIRAIGVGQSLVSCTLFNGKSQSEVISVELNVIAHVEQIKLNNDLDYQEGEYIIASDKIDFDFTILPTEAANQKLSYALQSDDGSEQNLAFMKGNQLCFIMPGVVNVIVNSEDGGASLKLRIRYTGGDAVGATLNVENKIEMEIGEQITVEVVKWLPKDTTNRVVTIRDISSSSDSAISVRAKTITAIAGGSGRVLVEISNGISKEIEISVIRRVSSIQIDDEILSAKSVIELNAEALPQGATNRVLTFTMEENSIASISENVLTFTEPGTVYVVISTTDGSNISKRVSVTSTMGYLNKLVLNASEKSLSKNDIFNLYIVQKYPLDARQVDIQFKILSSSASDGSENPVISLNENGTIKALYGGQAVVRAFAEGYGGEEVYADCEVTVFVPVTGIDVEFSRKLDLYQNAYLTSQSEIEFTAIVYPVDASIRTFTYSIKGGQVQGNKIIFSDRIIELKVISDDSSAGERSKSYTFWYMANDLVEATIDTTGIENNKIRLMAEETFTFKVNNVLPSDNQNLQFTIQNTSERRVDENKMVATFENGVLKALNGGEFDFTLYLNNKLIGQFSLIVTRFPTEIMLDGGDNIYVSQPYYKINAKINPSDAVQGGLVFECNDDGASVNDNGEVTFTSFGTYQITIYIRSYPSITKTVTIKYTKELSAIEFNDTKSVMYVNDFVYIKVFPKPYDAAEFEYTVETDVEGIVSLTKTDDGQYILRGLKSGKVIVTAKVVGKDIEVSKEFVIIEQIDDIKLELDKSNDNLNGKGNYRYFATKFLSADGNITNQYKMKVTIKPESASLDLLEWKSSCDEIATVESDGTVTFLKAGKVTITVSQIKTYEGAVVCKDSYEFTIVEGINVYNFDEFLKARELLSNSKDGWNKDLKDNFYAIVLHSDIVFGNSLTSINVIDYNLYGNGYMINLEKVKERDYFSFTIKRDNIIIDNVTIRSRELAAGSALSKLDGTGGTILIEGCKNVLIYNTEFENSDYHVQVHNARATFAGCIFRNALSCGIEMKTHDQSNVSTLRVKDSIFTNILLCGIMFGFDNSPTANKLILEGDVRFYNWATIDEIENGLKSKLSGFMKENNISQDVLNPLISQVKTMVAKQTNYCYHNKSDGKDYYHVGVLQASASLVGHDFTGNGLVERSELNPKFNYSPVTMNGSINLGLTTASWEMKILSLTNSSPFITPGESYTTALPTIMQPNRF